MTPEIIAVIVVGIIICGVVAYLHTAAGKTLEDKLKADFDKIHSKLDSVHAAALAPVTVTVVPSATPGAPIGAPVASQPVAPTVDHVGILNGVASIVAASKGNPNPFGAAYGVDGSGGSGSVGVAEVVSSGDPYDVFPYPNMWMKTCQNGTKPSKSGMLPAGNYRVDMTEGYAYVAFSSDVLGPITVGQAVSLQADTPMIVTADVTPGNPNGGGQTKFGIKFTPA